MKNLFFFIVLLSEFSKVQAADSNEIQFTLKNFYAKNILSAISFDSMQYNNKCIWSNDSVIFEGFAFDITGKQIELSHLTSGKIDTLVILDSMGNLLEGRIVHQNGTETSFWFHSNGNLFHKVLTETDGYCDSQNGKLTAVFGTTPRYLFVETFYPSGIKKSEIHFDSLYKHNGESRIYYENGALFVSAFFENGKCVGKWKMYGEKGIRVGFAKWDSNKIKNARWYEYDAKYDCCKKIRVKNYMRTNEKFCSDFVGIHQEINFW